MLDKSLLKKHLTLVLDALLHNEDVRCGLINEVTWYCMTYYAFAVPEKSDIFRHKIMGDFDVSSIQKYFNNNQLLHQTGTLFAKGNKQVEEWKSESEMPIYLDNKLIKLFPPQKIEYFGGEKSTDLICCKDKTDGDIVGVICPVSPEWIKQHIKK